MFQTGSEANKLLGCPFKFHRRGQCGMEMSEVIPHIGSIADDLCLVRSMHSEHNNHTEALVMMNTGKMFPGRPALGSWISYALGTENQNLPAYIVLRDPEGYNTSGTLLWQNGWLPALYRGTEVSTKGTPVLNLQPAAPLPARRRSGATSTFWPGSTKSIAALSATNRSWKRAFATTSWPRGCSWRPATCSTCPAKRQPPASCTASTIPRPPATARAA